MGDCTFVAYKSWGSLRLEVRHAEVVLLCHCRRKLFGDIMPSDITLSMLRLHEHALTRKDACGSVVEATVARKASLLHDVLVENRREIITEWARNSSSRSFRTWSISVYLVLIGENRHLEIMNSVGLEANETSWAFWHVFYDSLLQGLLIVLRDICLFFFFFFFLLFVLFFFVCFGLFLFDREDTDCAVFSTGQIEFALNCKKLTYGRSWMSTPRSPIMSRID